MPVELAEDLLLDAHLLERRLDDDVGLGRSREPDGGRDQRQALVAPLRRQRAARHRHVVDRGDAVHAVVDLRLLLSRSASPGCRHWRSTSRCRRPSCRRRSPRRCAIGRGFTSARDARHLGGLALGEEEMAQRLRALIGDELQEQRPLLRQPLLEAAA